MAIEQPGYKIGILKAAADLSALQYRFVTVDVNGNVAQQTVLGARSLGVLGNKPTLNQSAEVVVIGATKVVAGGTIAAGAQVTSNATGQAVAAAATQYVIGTCLLPAASGDITTVLLKHEGVL